LDFGLCFDPQPYPDVRAVEIVRSPTRVTVRAGHPLTRAKRESDPQRLSRYPLATAKHLPGVIACSSHPIFQKVAEPVTVRYYFDSYDVAAEILATSDAWSILPLASIEESQGRLRALFPESYEWIQLKLVWNQSDEHSGLMEALISELGKAAKHFGWAVESVAGVPGRSGLRKKPEITDRQPKHGGVEA
jgi:DNA-binding transcriptional LysR family regulator